MSTFNPHNSYLQIFFPYINLSRTRVIAISDNGCRCFWTGDSTVRHECLIVLAAGDRKNFHKQLEEILAEYSPRYLHILLRPLAGRGFIYERFRQVYLIRRICRTKGIGCCHCIGIKGNLHAPSMLVFLKKNILSYVDTVVFRGEDSLLKLFVKKTFIALSGALTWKDYLVVAMAKKHDRDNRGCPGLPEVEKAGNVDEDLGFVIFTGDRKISFVFKSDAIIPSAVVKSGNRADLYAEYRHCSRAREILGDAVPEIYGFEVNDMGASLSLECVRERVFKNVVAAKFFFRRKAFIRAAVELFDFFLKVFADFVKLEKPIVSCPLPEVLADIKACLAVVGEGFHDKSFLVEKVFLQVCDRKIPWIMQHGDFCPRNIFFAEKDRKVLIDWEDMCEKQWPLMDLGLLLLTLKEHYVSFFNAEVGEFLLLPGIKEKFLEVKQQVCSVLNIESEEFRSLLFLSTAALCRQNFRKNRMQTARMIYRELVSQVSDFGAR